MFVEVKFRCRECKKVAIVEAQLSEEYEQPSCGCCGGRYTGRFYVELPQDQQAPEGWQWYDVCNDCRTV